MKSNVPYMGQSLPKNEVIRLWIQSFQQLLLSRRKKKHRSPFDRLSHSEKQLMEFKEMDDKDKIIAFRTHLKPAISRLRSIIINASATHYSQLELLNKDYLYSDVEIMPYYASDEKLHFERLSRIFSESYPQEPYEVIDKRTGHCIDEEGNDFYSRRIAVDDYMNQLCDKWLAEIPNIEKAITYEEEVKELPMTPRDD